MQILGIDFSSSPKKRTPMFVVGGAFDGDELHLNHVEVHSTNVLRDVLGRPGPWVLGLDVPFGMPTSFLTAVGWSLEWADYISHAGSMPWSVLKSTIDTFRAGRPDGSKDVYRPCDRQAKALPSIKTVKPPLARMFQVAAPVLLNAGCDILPFRANGSDRTVVEVYPRLVARRLGVGKYKSSDLLARPTEAARRIAVQRIAEGALTEAFGFSIRLAPGVAAAAIENEPGEAIDSMFAAIEAAWAFRNRERKWGIPFGQVSDTGWIVDPGLVSFSESGEPVAIEMALRARSITKTKQSMQLQNAISYALDAHAGQLRKGTHIPYCSHLLTVTGLVLEFGGNEDEAIAGVLHDAVEDAGGQGRLREIRARFGARVADIVEGCTDTDVVPKPPFRERKETYLRHLEHASASVRLVSAADKLANVRSIVQDYRAIGEGLWERFNGGCSGTLWYYRALAEVFNRLGPQRVAAELAAALRDLESLMALPTTD